MKKQPFPKYECLVCLKEKGDSKEYTFRNLDTHISKNHQAKHSPYLRCPYEGGKCRRYCTSRRTLINHFISVHENRECEVYIEDRCPRKIDFRCLVCGKVFTRSNYLSAHLNAKHAGAMNTFTCNYCGHITQTPNALLRHSFMKHPEEFGIKRNISKRHPSYKCLVCVRRNGASKKYRSRDLGNHILKNHVNPQPYKRCTLNDGNCVRYFATRQTFSRHVKAAHRNEDYKHSIEELFPRVRSALCLICGEVFNQNSDLSEHLNANHVGEEGTFACRYCSHINQTWSAICRHLLDNHKKELGVTKLTRRLCPKYKCLICEKERGDDTMYDYQALDIHILQFHENPLPYYIRCPHRDGRCRRHFTSTSSSLFYRHADQVHKNRGFTASTERILPR